jgi:solute carrier family 66 (lysosomal lysine-arginine transporter), member 1
MTCVCVPEFVENNRYNQFIGEYFSDCVYSNQDLFSFWIGLAGMFCSCVSLFPQFAVNYKLKNVDGISLYLLLLWSFGDLSNLLGTILASQLKTQVITGVMFTCLDFSMLGQYLYYKYFYKSLQEEEIVVASRSPFLGVATGLGIAGSLPIVQSKLTILATEICNSNPLLDDSAIAFGYIFAWISGMLYFTSRIPQVIQNYRNKSVEGLSLFLFVLTILGNLGYGVSILLRLPALDQHFFFGTLPYLIGKNGV